MSAFPVHHGPHHTWTWLAVAAKGVDAHASAHHGTHVAGIAAAVAGDYQGVVGVAPDARLVPVKVMSDSGTGEWSNLVCGIDHLTGLALDGDPTNDIHVANMSIGDTGSIGDCSDGGVREAICTSVAAGITYVAAAGNSTTDASTFIPAAFSEVITVSATVDLDREPGGLGGCALWIFYCGDTLAEFSNYGAVIRRRTPTRTAAGRAPARVSGRTIRTARGDRRQRRCLPLRSPRRPSRMLRRTSLRAHTERRVSTWHGRLRPAMVGRR